MAFLTGIDLETHLREEGHLEALPLAKPRRRSPPSLGRELALKDAPAKDVDYNNLLSDALQIEAKDDLEELRRMIGRTRKKMDAQCQNMAKWTSDVREIRGADRSFEKAPALTYSASTPALAGAPAPKPRALPAPGRGRDQPGVRPPLALPSSDERTMAKRSGGHSHSTPALAAAGRQSLDWQAAPLALPPRRAPPGAEVQGSQGGKAVSAARRKLGPSTEPLPVKGLSRAGSHGSAPLQ